MPFHRLISKTPGSIVNITVISPFSSTSVTTVDITHLYYLLSGTLPVQLITTSGTLYDYNSEARLSGSDVVLVTTSGALYDYNQGALISGAGATELVTSSGALYDYNQPAYLSGSDVVLITTSGSLYDVNQGALLSGTNSVSISWI